MKNIVGFVFMFAMSFSAFAQRQVSVTGRGTESTYCYAQSGPTCLDQLKWRAQSAAEQDARQTCEWTYRGKSLTYTVFAFNTCNPYSLPFDNEATWAQCRSEVQMQCEVQQ